MAEKSGKNVNVSCLASWNQNIIVNCQYNSPSILKSVLKTLVLLQKAVVEESHILLMKLFSNFYLYICRKHYPK